MKTDPDLCDIVPAHTDSLVVGMCDDTRVLEPKPQQHARSPWARDSVFDGRRGKLRLEGENPMMKV